MTVASRSALKRHLAGTRPLIKFIAVLGLTLDCLNIPHVAEHLSVFRLDAEFPQFSFHPRKRPVLNEIAKYCIGSICKAILHKEAVNFVFLVT